jgi:hypothetical protein
MRSPISVLAETDWAGLEHVYGPANDAPDELVRLLSEDAGQCGTA